MCAAGSANVDGNLLERGLETLGAMIRRRQSPEIPPHALSFFSRHPQMREHTRQKTNMLATDERERTAPGTMKKKRAPRPRGPIKLS